MVTQDYELKRLMLKINHELSTRHYEIKSHNHEIKMIMRFKMYIQLCYQYGIELKSHNNALENRN